MMNEHLSPNESDRAEVFNSHGEKAPVREGHPADRIMARAGAMAEEAEREYADLSASLDRGPVVREKYEKIQEAAKFLEFCRHGESALRMYAEAKDDPKWAGLAQKMEDKVPELRSLWEGEVRSSL